MSGASSKWVLRRPEEPAPSLISEFGPLLGGILWARGFDAPPAAQAFLNPSFEGLTSPFKMQDMQAAAERLAQAVTSGECICVYADYDMDGISGLALLESFLKACGTTQVSHYQPHRFDDGYGLHPEALAELHGQGVKVVVTVDTGTTALAAAAKARELDLHLIITDHHQTIPELPDTPWLVNPNRPDDESGLGYLSGVGVAFYLCIALRSVLRERGWFKEKGLSEPDLRKWLDLFTLGTVGDVVDLKNDNRVLVRTGLEQLLRTRRAGLRCLVDRVFAGTRRISARDVGFSLVPKLNAASRMGQAELSTRLLLCDDPVVAGQIVDKIIELNTQRSDIQAQVFAEALEQAVLQMEQDPKVLTVRGPWHEGVLGIVAAKIGERFGRPAIVLAEMEAGEEKLLRGSMRAKAPCHCVKLLDGASAHLIRYGGHQAAAGMQMKASSWDGFVSDLARTAEQLDYDQTQELAFDGEIDRPPSLEDIVRLERLAPWGAGNPEPLLLMRRVPVSLLGLLKEVHVKGKVGGADVIGFSRGAEFEALRAQKVEHIDVLAVPEINIFRNQPKVQLRIEGLRASE